MNKTKYYHHNYAKIKKVIISLSFLSFFSGCSYFKDKSYSDCIQRKNNIQTLADRHELKLKSYFLNGSNGNTDLSSLISETRAISQQLKSSGIKKRANKFDSYVDVLTYGNRTLDESIKDTEDLVKRNEIAYKQKQNESSICKFLSKILP